MDEEELEKRVLSEINLDHRSLEEGVTHLIHWLSKQPHLPDTADEELLKAFVVGSKSVERAKLRLDRYFTARTKYPEAYSVQNRDPKLLKFNQLEKVIILPGHTPEGYKVIMMEIPLTKEEVDAFSLMESAKMFFMMLDVLFRTQPVTSGQMVAINCKGVTMDYMAKYLTSYTSALFQIYQNVLPIRLKGCLCYNASSTAELFCNKVLKVFLKGKLSERVFVHAEDHTVLSKYFPSEMLPCDLGGKSPSQHDLWKSSKETVEKERDWLMGEGSVGADLSKRPKGHDDDDQIQGTFRKLEID